jgi:hypothetical protein
MIARAARALTRRLGFWSDALRAAGGGCCVSDAELACALVPGANATVFFFDANSRERLACRFKADCPDTAAAVVAWADRICLHQCDLLGSGPADMGDPIRWRRDFVTGREWVRSFSPLLPVQYGDGSDIKRVWELSRCQHFAVLGEAYALTGDEKYAREWVAQMSDWERENPPLMGPNWMVPMEASIRIVNWIWGPAFMGDSPAFDASAQSVFRKGVLSHARFVLRHLERYGNHRFSNFVGLVFCGVCCPEFKEAADWRRAGMAGLCGELAKQVGSDGCHFEGSLPYHRLVLEMAASCALLLERNGEALPAEAMAEIGRMLEFSAAALEPNGFAMQVGDADDGRLQELTPLDKRDHGYLLHLGAVLTGESRHKTADKPHPEAFWLMGEDGLAAYEQLPLAGAPSPSRAFADSGFYVMRSNRIHVFVSCRRPHALDTGAHAHNDHLSFTLSLDGQEVIVDAGTGTYTGDLGERHRFRGSAAHNTVTVNGAEINPIKESDPFRLKDEARCRVVEWECAEREVALTAEHDGYARLGVRVQRRFVLDRAAHVLRIRDRVEGKGEHEVVWRFLFAPETQAVLDRGIVRLTAGGAETVIQLPAGLECRIDPGLYSPSYGVRQRTSRLVVAARGKLPMEAEFVVRPGGRGDAR